MSTSPVGSVPYLPRHNHAPEGQCEPGCPWHDWQAHVREHGDPYPSAQTDGAGQPVEYVRYLAVVTDLTEALDVLRELIALEDEPDPWDADVERRNDEAVARARVILAGTGDRQPLGLAETVRAALRFLVTTRGGEPWITRALSYRSHGGEILVLTTGGYRTEDGTAMPGETAGDSPERRALVAAHTELLRILTTPPDHLVQLVAERIRTERGAER
jgi:hypothetical protein